MNKVSDFVEKNFDKYRDSNDNYITHCPFHDDKTPSLSIHKQNGYFLCFSCGEKGSFSKLRSKLGDMDTYTKSNTNTFKPAKKADRSTSSRQKFSKKKICKSS